MKFLKITDGHVTELPVGGGLPDQAHVFEQDAILAVNAAIAARRPLLVRGEPGTGKSQLPRAVAAELGCPFVPYVVDSRSESRDLLWHFDAVKRLAVAQLVGATKAPPRKIEAQLATDNFLAPGPLWWAFDWHGAEVQARTARAPLRHSPRDWNADEAGCVVLIDEIDKAEADVPNGLLEALGAGRFVPFGRTAPVVIRGAPPLVVITTNEERTLPDAFLRRCLVLPLRLPDPGDELIKHLVERGRAHFAADPEVLSAAAHLLNHDRAEAIENDWRPRPGQAEYLDLVRAVLALEDTAEAQQAHLAKISRFTLQKDAEGRREPMAGRA